MSNHVRRQLLDVLVNFFSRPAVASAASSSSGDLGSGGPRRRAPAPRGCVAPAGCVRARRTADGLLAASGAASAPRRAGGVRGVGRGGHVARQAHGRLRHLRIDAGAGQLAAGLDRHGCPSLAGCSGGCPPHGLGNGLPDGKTWQSYVSVAASCAIRAPERPSAGQI